MYSCNFFHGPIYSRNPCPKIDIKFMTGPMGGAWYPLGGAIAEAIQKEIPGVNVAVMPGGALANAEAIDLGKCDIGFSHTMKFGVKSLVLT
jgi:TRAP-type uncharacterized transport system substrate-binding protein